MAAKADLQGLEVSRLDKAEDYQRVMPEDFELPAIQGDVESVGREDKALVKVDLDTTVLGFH